MTEDHFTDSKENNDSMSLNPILEEELPLRERLNRETAQIAWKELELFFAKGSLLQIAPGLDLVDIAEQIATNDQDSIENLITLSQIAFATPEWVKQNCKAETLLWAVVVAPYVVCQLKTS